MAELDSAGGLYDVLVHGQAREQAGDLEGALDLYVMAMVDHLDSPSTALPIELRMLAVLAQLDRADEALGLAAKLEHRGVRSPTIAAAKANAYTTRARVLRTAGQRSAALEAALQVTVLAPTWSEGWFELGTDYKALGRFAEAIAAVTHCVSLEPEQGDGWYNLACYRCLAGDAVGALEALDLAVRIASQNAQHAVDDPDFAAIRGDERFLAITA